MQTNSKSYNSKNYAFHVNNQNAPKEQVKMDYSQKFMLEPELMNLKGRMKGNDIPFKNLENP